VRVACVDLALPVEIAAVVAAREREAEGERCEEG
jgi:hypothetical protein